MGLNNEMIKSEHKREMDKMGLNNEIIKSEHKREMDKMELNNKYLIDKMEIQHTGCNGNIELNEKVERLLKNQSNKNWW
jgi:hypothetical protein